MHRNWKLVVFEVVTAGTEAVIELVNKTGTPATMEAVIVTQMDVVLDVLLLGCLLLPQVPCWAQRAVRATISG